MKPTEVVHFVAGGISVLALGFLIFWLGFDLSTQKALQFARTQLLAGSTLVSVPVAPSASPNATPAVGNSSTGVGQSVELTSAMARKAKINGEILHEVFLVVFIGEPKDRAEFGNWLDTLNQGASLEGVYNGLVHSGEYRRLEASTGSASPHALRIFGEEVAMLESDSIKLGESDSSSPSPTTVDLTGLAERDSKQYVGASIYTLKRVIGDQAFKTIAVRNEFREKLALWYSKWVLHMTQRDIDFGLALRNKQDEAFHFKWALESGEDQIKWEVLNRLHRVLNDADRVKQ